MDFSEWPIEWIDEVEELISEIVFNEYESNIITVVHNPLLVVVIACELLNNIAHSHKRLKTQANKTKDKLVILCQKLIESHDDHEMLVLMINEKDFKDRKLFDIIVQNGVPQLLNNSKFKTIMEEMWSGNAMFGCNGKLHDLSRIH